MRARLVSFAAILIAAFVAYSLPDFVPDESGALQCLRPSEAGTSLLAVGDVGRPAGFTRLFDTQLSVAAGMDREHREAPVDALLLLGDNFYPRGLSREDLPRRIRENLVRPYCRFLAFSGARAAEVVSACGISAELRQPVPMVAVLGNHDEMQPGSADLERHEVARYISNWRMSRDLADVTELAGGVSVIHFDSVALRAGEDSAPLVDALRASRGPWRVLAGHHPLLEQGVVQEDRYRDRVLEALDEAGVRAHVLLAGHEHNLQVGVTRLAALPLQVIAGSGAGARPLHSEILGRQFIRLRPGYARLDLERRGEAEWLVVSLSSVADYPFQFWRSPQIESCWRVTLDGDVAETGSRSPSSVQ